MPDVIVIGGGVIGLSIAWELAGHGASVRVLEQSGFGTEASWAGAGMLPPGNPAHARTAEARLRGAAHQLWPKWSRELTSSTGIDNGYQRCGCVETCFPDAEDSSIVLSHEIELLREEGIVVETDDLAVIRERFPALSPELIQGYLLPEFCQVRNPWHLRALQAGCVQRGVELCAGTAVRDFDIVRDRIDAVYADEVVHRADEFVIASGAWSGELLRQIGRSLPIEPIRGQMVLLQVSPTLLRSVIELGPRYLVPRSDGRILVGSTEERAGFDKRNTASAIAGLLEFAQRVVPALKDARFEKCWAGLRPHSATGQPIIGRLPHLANASVAAGHFRHGLHLSPITAVLMRQILMRQAVQLPEECLTTV